MDCKSQFGLSPRPNEDTHQKSDKSIALSNDTGQDKPQKHCCFLSCNKLANVTCYDCSDVYCTECWNTVHKSAKLLALHKKVPFERKVEMSAVFEICSKHTMEREYSCDTCKMTVCCFCVIEEHGDHDKLSLSKLTPEEQSELSVYKESAMDNLKSLRLTKDKLSNMKIKETSVIQKEISDYFTQLTAKFQVLEEDLKKSAIDKLQKSFEDLFSEINKIVEDLEKVLASCDAMKTEKLNAKRILYLLKDACNLAYSLLNKNENRENEITLSVDPTINNIESFFKIKETKDSYRINAESDFQLITKDVTNSVEDDIPMIKEELQKVKSAPKIQTTLPEKFEKIEITHIDSLESFYVHRTTHHRSLFKLNQEIKKVATSSDPIEHTSVQINRLYLVLAEHNTVIFWSRGRIVEILNCEVTPFYKVFFIDYGRTQTVDIAKIREMPSLMRQKKPFAAQCRLHDVVLENWSDNAHIVMRQIITDEDIFMRVRNVQGGIYDVELYVSYDGKLTSILDLLPRAVVDAPSKKIVPVSNVESLPRKNIESTYTIFSSSAEFTRGQQEDVVLANIIDPYTIYVHLKKCSKYLRKLTLEMERFFDTESRRTNFIPIEGTYVLVKYKDSVRGNVHRAFMENVDMINQQVDAYCIDWGMQIRVPLSYTCMITENFTKRECLAILIKLVDIKPYQNASTWDYNATECLLKYFRSQEVLNMLVYNANPLEVALFEKHESVDICINSLLVTQNLADSTGRASTILKWKHSDYKDPFSSNGTLLSEMISRVEHLSDSSDDDINILKQSIQIVSLKSPNLIYIKFLINEAMENELHKHLQIHYSKERIPSEAWSINDLCVVLHENCYYRGKIIESQDKKYQIYLFDLGVSIRLTKDQMFMYNKYFSKFPNVVFKAHLGDIRPAGGDQWSMASTEVLQKIFDCYKDIYATKVQGDASKESIPMKMWYKKVKISGALEPTVTRLICINSILVKLGYASKKSNDVEPVNLDDSVSSEIHSATENLDLTRTTDDTESQCSIEPTVTENIDESINYKTLEANITDWKPAFRVKKRKFFAYITCVETEGIMYVREETLQSVYKEMESSMKEYFDNKKIDADYCDWKPGELCTILSDGYYYRGTVYSVKSPTEIVVIMVDFGSDHQVSYRSLYREILYPEIKPFATKIKLNRIFAKHGKWLSSDFETFLSIIPEYSYITIQGPLDAQIPLAEVFDSQHFNINDLLVAQCPNLLRSLPVEVPTFDDENAAIIEEEETNIIGKEFSYSYEIFEEGKKTEVIIEAILDYNIIAVRKLNEVLEEDLKMLNNEIRKHVDTLPMPETIKLCMPCVCRYSGDGEWYRAEVYNIDSLDFDKIVVFFVDFGNLDFIQTENIKIMIPEWCQVPVCCQIIHLNFDLKNPVSKECVIERMKPLLHKKLYAEITHKEPVTANLYAETGESCFQPLITSGLIKMKL